MSSWYPLYTAVGAGSFVFRDDRPPTTADVVVGGVILLLVAVGALWSSR